MKISVLGLAVMVTGLSFVFSCKKTDPPQAEVVITTLSASHAGGDSSLTITGTGFSAIAGEDIVEVNGRTAVVNSATVTSLVITIPKKAGDGEVSVTVKQKTG